jgi:hypothetical protein
MTPAGKSNKLQRMSAPISSLPATSPEHRKRDAEASTTARIGLAFYLVLIVYASCYCSQGGCTIRRIAISIR